jgi:DNA repair exonuclease SbcCD nuclease subunit
VRAIWELAVSTAIEKRVDAVILTGDMADNENAYFEAYGALRRGITQLSREHIPVVAIAGNHDYDVFPQLAESMAEDNFIFLGRGGTWSETVLRTRSGRNFRCIGWSFPSSHYNRSPLDSLRLNQSDDFTIGIVHGDLDTQSKYAPLTTQNLVNQPVSLWLLGHVHAPKFYDDHRVPILYPGSPQPLDPGEPGIHGPWMITINQNNQIKAVQLPLASVRYETIPVNVSAAVQISDVKTLVAEQLEQRGNELAESHPTLQYLSCRPVLTGQTRLHRTLSTEGLPDVEDLDIQVSECSIAVDKVYVETAPIRDLKEIAQLNNDPPGILARWILELERGGDHVLLDHARKSAASVYESVGFRSLGKKEPDTATLSKLVIQQSMLLLDELLAQKEENA